MLMVSLAIGTAFAGSAPQSARSFKAEVLFRLTHPCPSTRQTRGECVGYVIDRIIPLACGGAEEPSNFQWQTISEAREKDRWERIGCRAGRKLVMPGGASYTEAFPLSEPAEPTKGQPLPLQ
jgi:hypothetical protein